MTVFAKDPASTLDYSFDWSGWLIPGETIDSNVWSIGPAGAGAASIVVGSESESADTRAVLVTGGTTGNRYRLSCRIITNGGRTNERSATLRVMEV